MQCLLETNERICYQNVVFFVCTGWLAHLVHGTNSAWNAVRIDEPSVVSSPEDSDPEPCVVAGGFHVS